MAVVSMEAHTADVQMSTGALQANMHKEVL